MIGLTPIFTWKLLTDSLASVLTGRRWLADGSVLFGGSILIVVIAAVLWYAVHPELLVPHLPIIIWSAAVLVIVKSLVAALAFRVALDRGLIRARSILRLLAFWAVIAIATLVLAHLLIPARSLAVPRPVALLAALSLLPLARFALAPLALDWNRRR